MGGKEKHQQCTTQLFYALFLGNDLANTTKLYLTRDVSAYFHLTCLKSAISLLRKVKAKAVNTCVLTTFLRYDFFKKPTMRTETPHTDPANPRGGVKSRGAPRAPPAPGCVEPLGAGSTARGSPQRPAREPGDICRAAAGGALPGHGARNGRRCLEPPPTLRPP